MWERVIGKIFHIPKLGGSPNTVKVFYPLHIVDDEI